MSLHLNVISLMMNPNLNGDFGQLKQTQVITYEC